MEFELYIFDLDGTLVDTRADLTTAVNEMLTSYGLEELSIDEVVSHVGDGMRKLVERSLGSRSIDIEEAIERFKKSYSAHLLDTTVPYTDIHRVLDVLKEKYLAILTNKDYHFTKKITDALDLAPFFSLIIGGDCFRSKKPSTQGIEYILDRSGISREGAVMVGDGKNDILAAKRAGITSIYAAYGFSDSTILRDFAPDHVIHRPGELLEIK